MKNLKDNRCDIPLVSVSAALMPKMQEYQKWKFNKQMFNKLPEGLQINLTLSALLNDADLLKTILEKEKK